MHFIDFCALCRNLEATRSRIAKIALTVEFFHRLEKEEIPWGIAFLTGRPFPVSDSRVLEIGPETLYAFADAEATPFTGNGGLTLLDVARGFARIAEASGKGSRQAKADLVRDLFGRARDEEREFIKRIMHGEMRVGLHDGLIQDAIARAVGADIKSVRRASLFLSDLSEVARIALTAGPPQLQQVQIRLFVPLLPMLSTLSDGFNEVLAAHKGRTALEFKYDGARIQIHKEGERVRIWSRRLSEVTLSLPDIVEIAAHFKANSFILDGEVVAVGKESRPLPFQELMRRFRRIRDVEASVKEIPLALYLFDCLFCDGSSLIDNPCEERWTNLERLTGGLHLAQRIIATDIATAEHFFEEALAAGHEGLMAKSLTSVYAPGNRGKNWFKIKRAKTVDCVIVAADRGSGRRRGWLSNYHLAVADEEGGFAPVGKTFKGLTDREFAAITEALWRLKLEDDGYTVVVRPEIVVEVDYDEIQRSPQYSSGFALRFARIAHIREDKGPSQITTLKELRDLYDRQFLTKGRFEI